MKRAMAKKVNRRAKQRTPLSKERVLHAAVTLADEIGIASLSMRKLGEALDVEAMSLYKHVANKDDILDGIVDIVASEIDVPEIGGDWQAAMRRRSTSAHVVLLRHPWATMLIVSRANVGPAMLRYVDATIGGGGHAECLPNVLHGAPVPIPIAAMARMVCLQNHAGQPVNATPVLAVIIPFQGTTGRPWAGDQCC